MTLLEPLAEYIVSLSLDDLSEQTIEKTELHVFDALGAMLAGSFSEDARAARRLLEKTLQINGPRDIPLAGFDFSAPLPAAVHIMATAARMTEIDDIHLLSCTTPGSIIVPTALCAACHAEEGGKRFLEGVLAGYEMITRLGTAVKGPVILYRGLWPTYLLGGICAAAVGAKILGLDRDRTRAALAIAFTMSTGLAGKIHTGLSSRWMTLGYALQNGLAACLAAEDGYAGDGEILDGPYASVYGFDLDKDILLQGLGETSQVEEMSLKPFCTARQTLSSIEAFRRLLEAHDFEPEEIGEIQVNIPEQYLQMINRPGFPEARVPSIVSVQYQMALGAYYEDDLYDLERKVLRDEKKIHDFIGKVRVAGSRDFTSEFPVKWPGKVSVRASGKTFELVVRDPLGSPDRPMNWGDVEEKIKRVVRGRCEPDRVEKLAAETRQLKGLPKVKPFIEGFPRISDGR